MTTNNPQDSYEQLKRKNRRRLVGAAVMVAAAGVLLLMVLKQKDRPGTPTQEVVLTGLNMPASEPASSAPAPSMAVASDDNASDLAPGAVLEPQPLPDNGDTASTAVAVPPLGSVATAVTPPEKPDSKPPEHKAVAAAPKAAPRSEPRPTVKAVPKPAPKLTPQDILNNKAATPAKPAAGNATGGGKALIQVGAFTNEQQARAVQQKLAAAGVRTQISQSQTSKGELYRVRTGAYASRAQAEQNLSRIRAQGLDGMIIGQ